ncbi:hypothetical protein GGI22_002182, partial [Coemansia erecta]
MQFTQIATIAMLAVSASAIPTRHSDNPPVAAAPIALDALQSLGLLSSPLTPNNDAAASAASARADRDARREERRKSWQDWAHTQGANGVPNGTAFVSQILDGV